MDVAEILEQIGKHNIKTVRGSIDDRDALRPGSIKNNQNNLCNQKKVLTPGLKYKPEKRRVLEQTPEVFYAKPDSKFGLTSSNRRSAAISNQNGTKRSKNDESKNSKLNTAPSSSSNGTKKTRKDSSERVRKISTDDLLSPETPLIDCNFKDFINEERFSKLGVHIQVSNKPKRGPLLSFLKIPNFKWELMKLLPACDVDIGPSGLPVLGRDCFSNEFFNRALTGFAERITDGEFTPAMKVLVTNSSQKRLLLQC